MKDIIFLKGGVRLNYNLYREYWRRVGRKAKDGIWDITVFPNGQYCFALKRFLGQNGKIDDHPLQDQIIKYKGEELVVDSICVHYDFGYYYHATLRNKNNSHAVVVLENINSIDKTVIESAKKFNKFFEGILPKVE